MTGRRRCRQAEGWPPPQTRNGISRTEGHGERLLKQRRTAGPVGRRRSRARGGRSALGLWRVSCVLRDERLRAGRRGRYVQAVASPHPHAKRGRAIWWFRAGALAFVVAYLLLPYSLTVYVPIWLPFLCVLAVEVQFFLSGLRSSPGQRPAGGIGGGPQEHDLVEL